MRISVDRDTQRSLIETYWKQGKIALEKTITPVLHHAQSINPEDLKRLTRSLLPDDEISGFLSDLWTDCGSQFAVRLSRHLRRQKSEPDDLTLWQQYFKRYAAERSAKVVGAILDTEAENINKVIDQFINTGEMEGWSIPRIAGNMRAGLGDALIDMNKYEAERIARTEVIGASNMGSYDGANDSGVDCQKFWITSGLPGIRESHLEYQGMGDVEMDYEYNTGLKFPGDPECDDASDVINCRCTIGYTTGDKGKRMKSRTPMIGEIKLL